MATLDQLIAGSSPGSTTAGRGGKDDALRQTQQPFPPPQQPRAPGDVLEELSRGLFERTAPLRESLISRSEDFLDGGGDVTGTPQFQALKSAADVQFGTARGQALEDVPAGGALIDALTNISGERASTLTRGAGELGERELGRAFSLATGAPLQTSVAGLGAAGGVQAGLAQAEAERESGAKQGIGSGAGGLLGGK